MTVIAYKDGILAADTATFGDDMIVGYYPKIHVHQDFCWAACGALTEVAAFDAWAKTDFKIGLQPPKSDNFGAVVVFRDNPNRIVFNPTYKPGGIYKCGETFVLYEVTHYGTPVVEGACREFLLGSMYAGRSAVEAIEAAIVCVVWAGGECSAFDTRAWEWVVP